MTEAKDYYKRKYLDKLINHYFNPNKDNISPYEYNEGTPIRSAEETVGYYIVEYGDEAFNCWMTNSKLNNTNSDISNSIDCLVTVILADLYDDRPEHLMSMTKSFHDSEPVKESIDNVVSIKSKSHIKMAKLSLCTENNNGGILDEELC